MDNKDICSTILTSDIIRCFSEETFSYMDLNFYNSAGSSQLQKLKYLIKYGELSSLNSLGKYIFESFKRRDKQS